MDATLYLPRLPVQAHPGAAHQFSSAHVIAVSACLRFCWQGSDAKGLSTGDRKPLPLLQLRGLHADIIENCEKWICRVSRIFFASMMLRENHDEG
jgi:hypothetical protein